MTDTDHDRAIVNSNGPYLGAAFLCEKVIEDKEGVLSAIRIVDRIVNTAVGPGAPADMPNTPVALTLVLTFKSGGAQGRQDVRITIERPDGLRSDLASSLSILMEGAERGANLILNLGLTMTQEGLYWFDVFLNDRLVTRVPLRIVYQRQLAGGQQAPPGSSGPSSPPSA